MFTDQFWGWRDREGKGSNRKERKTWQRPLTFIDILSCLLLFLSNLLMKYVLTQKPFSCTAILSLSFPEKALSCFKLFPAFVFLLLLLPWKMTWHSPLHVYPLRRILPTHLIHSCLSSYKSNSYSVKVRLLKKDKHTHDRSQRHNCWQNDRLTDISRTFVSYRKNTKHELNLITDLSFLLSLSFCFSSSFIFVSVISSSLKQTSTTKTTSDIIILISLSLQYLQQETKQHEFFKSSQPPSQSSCICSLCTCSSWVLWWWRWSRLTYDINVKLIKMLLWNLVHNRPTFYVWISHPLCLLDCSTWRRICMV